MAPSINANPFLANLVFNQSAKPVGHKPGFDTKGTSFGTTTTAKHKTNGLIHNPNAEALANQFAGLENDRFSLYG
ncbi:MAG: hypothetical protein VKJ06_04070 [Vampirovibrionales bacterium]|nr:hypothetical protein [Vampirovibrionales bacterium]